jgi:hypothetical protein
MNVTISGVTRLPGNRTKTTTATKLTKEDHENSSTFFVSFFVTIVAFVGLRESLWTFQWKL